MARRHPVTKSPFEMAKFTWPDVICIGIEIDQGYNFLGCQSYIAVLFLDIVSLFPSHLAKLKFYLSWG